MAKGIHLGRLLGLGGAEQKGVGGREEAGAGIGTEGDTACKAVWGRLDGGLLAGVLGTCHPEDVGPAQEVKH